MTLDHYFKIADQNKIRYEKTKEIETKELPLSPEPIEVEVPIIQRP